MGYSGTKSLLVQLKWSTGFELDALNVQFLIDVICVVSDQVVPEAVSLVERTFFSYQQR